MKQIHGGDIYRHPGALDFSANMNPLGTPPAVIRAAQEAVTRICCYPDVQQQELKEALGAYEQTRQEWLFCGNGAAEVIFVLMQAVRPKKALVLAPTFAEYELALKSVGAQVEAIPLREEDGFRLRDPGQVYSLLDGETDMVCLCNPNNPTGELIGRETLEAVAEACAGRNIRLLLDECFLDFIDEPERYTMKGALGRYKNLFLLKAFTKRYSMAGIRLGYGLCADRGLLEQMERCVQPWNLSIPAQAAGVAALKEEDYVRRARELIRTERGRMRAEMERLGLAVYGSKANYLFFRGPEGLDERCLKENILIRNCGNYRGLSEGWYRTAVKLPGENDRLLAALAYSLNGWGRNEKNG